MHAILTINAGSSSIKLALFEAHDSLRRILEGEIKRIGLLRLWRFRGESPFAVGAAGTPRVLVRIAGAGQLEHDGVHYAVGQGDVMLLPAVVGACAFRPHVAVSLFEIALPEVA